MHVHIHFISFQALLVFRLYKFSGFISHSNSFLNGCSVSLLFFILILECDKVQHFPKIKSKFVYCHPNQRWLT